MPQVMVNFRMDEEVKRSMEQACREMGLSMTAAFTIFAKKVGKEKRIPFEIAAEPHRPEPYRRRGPAEAEQDHGEAELLRRRERLELLCAEIRQSLTAIHTAIPSSIAGIPMERIRLLCGDELKDKTAEVTKDARALFSARNAGMLKGKDLGVLDEYLDGLSSIGSQLLEIEQGLIPAMRSRQGEDGGFEPYGQRLAAISKELDGLAPVMQRFLRSTACESGARALKARIQQAAAPVETPYVLTALESLEALIFRHHDSLEGRTRARLEGDYLQTLELTLRELAQAEQEGGDTGAKAALCLRVVNVMSQTISDGRKARQEWDDRSLEAEVSALERLAAMRGDVGDGLEPED